MTVIATDGESMAGDSLTTASGQIVAYRAKVVQFADGRIAGACGDTTECRKLMASDRFPFGFLPRFC